MGEDEKSCKNETNEIFDEVMEVFYNHELDFNEVKYVLQMIKDEINFRIGRTTISVIKNFKES